MRKVHDIIPRQKRLKKAMLQLRFQLLIKGFISCLRYDTELKKEVEAWPEGFAFQIVILPGEDGVTLQKGSGSLHKVDNSCLNGYPIRILFKNIHAADCVFSGKMSFFQALNERRFIMEGNFTSVVSLMRSLMLVQNTLYPRLIRRELQNSTQKRISRLKVFRDILFLKNSGKGVDENDPEVLRVYE